MTNQSNVKDYAEINLLGITESFGPVLKRWRSIFLTAILIVCGRAVSLLILPTDYEAYATVVLVKTRTDVQFDTRIRTSQPDDTAALSEYRRNALTTLGRSQKIAKRTFDKFKDRLPQNMTLFDLLDIVLIYSGARNDIVNIFVTLPDPVLAADVATFWAQQLETESNAMFSGVTTSYVTQVDEQLARVTVEMESAQTDLLNAIRSSEGDTLRLLINQKVRELDRLEAMRLQPLLGSLQRKQSELGVAASINASQARVRQLRTLAKTMLDQLERGGDAAAATNTMALVNLKLQVYAIMPMRNTSQSMLDMTMSSVDRSRVNDQRAGVDSSQLSTIFGQNLNLYMPSDLVTLNNAAAQRTDLSSLVAVLDALDKQLDEDLKSASNMQDQTAAPVPMNLTDIDVMIEGTTKELRQARADLEEVGFRIGQLTYRRDSLRDTVQALRAKRNEVDVAFGVGSSYVRLLSEANPPVYPAQRRLVKLAIAGGVGIGVGIVVAFVMAVRAGAYRRRPVEAAL